VESCARRTQSSLRERRARIGPRILRDARARVQEFRGAGKTTPGAGPPALGTAAAIALCMKLRNGIVIVAGTLGALVVGAPWLVSRLDGRSSSLRSRYRADVRAAIEAARALPPPALVTPEDLAPLPAPVQRYLQRAGVVGKPHPRSLHAVFRARFRMGADRPWMSSHVEQQNFFGPQPRRLFYMTASRAGIPFVGFHRYVGAEATMQVRVAGLVPVVDARGPEMTQGETVTMLNDMCVLAPAALLSAPITWETLGEREVRATFTNAGKTISAVLTFDAAGDLVGFVSHDRYQSDGKVTRLFPWSTPLGGFRDFGGVRLPADGQARWREPSGEWTYGEFVLEDITYDEELR
jgi:hypothetical protein